MCCIKGQFKPGENARFCQLSAAAFVTTEYITDVLLLLLTKGFIQQYILLFYIFMLMSKWHHQAHSATGPCLSMSYLQELLGMKTRLLRTL